MNEYPSDPAHGDPTATSGPLTLPEPGLAQSLEDQPRVTAHRILVPLLLFAACCVTTYRAGGPIYAGALVLTLFCHEMGHYLQTLRYRVAASLPLFIPMPYGPLGTMGAVISMRGNIPNRKALFDIGISGPLAGLVPAVFFSVLGLSWSHVEPQHMPGSGLGSPLLFKWLVYLIFGNVPEGLGIELHPLAYAGWVGVFITALNLFPVGQLDGGHVLYAIMRRGAHVVASALLFFAIAAMFLSGHYEWLLMVMLVLLLGPNHPPTADDSEPLGTGRTILGLATLTFVFIGFTPTPFIQ